ncbi:MAG TPA: hypothetical protein QGF05_00620, partial [Dehalococcoidia bacterium]|nr:hypothetical protein [Dehalococcoidia bacterium]
RVKLNHYVVALVPIKSLLGHREAAPIRESGQRFLAGLAGRLAIDPVEHVQGAPTLFPIGVTQAHKPD